MDGLSSRSHGWLEAMACCCLASRENGLHFGSEGEEQNVLCGVHWTTFVPVWSWKILSIWGGLHSSPVIMFPTVQHFQSLGTVWQTKIRLCSSLPERTTRAILRPMGFSRKQSSLIPVPWRYTELGLGTHFQKQRTGRAARISFWGQGTWSIALATHH